jgi:hypothetical protein
MVFQIKLMRIYIINTKRHNPEYLITDAKQLMINRFLFNYDDKNRLNGGILEYFIHNTLYDLDEEFLKEITDPYISGMHKKFIVEYLIRYGDIPMVKKCNII